MGDASAVAELVEAMGGHEGARHKPRTIEALGASIASPLTRCLVAVAAGNVVGYGQIDAGWAVHRSCREATLSVLAVAPGARSNGIGSRLLERLDLEAALLGCDELVLSSSTNRTRAHSFYALRGFEELAAAKRFRRRVGFGGSATGFASRFLLHAARAAVAVEAAIAGLERAEPVGTGADGARTEAADAAAEAAALAELAALELPLVSEERGVVLPPGGAGNGVAPGAPGQPWVAVDPLDGSRNFRQGLGPHATSYGLVVDGRPVAGFVCELSTGRRWWASSGGGAWVDGRRCQPARNEIAAAPSPLPGCAVEVPEGFSRLRISGSTATDLCRVASGELGAFVALEREVVHTHDLAGPWAVLEEAGCTVVDLQGRRPRLCADPRVTYLIRADAPCQEG